MTRKIGPYSFLLLLICAVWAAGCATRKYVRQEVAPAQTQINEIRLAQGEQAERIDAVDREAATAMQSAQIAGRMAVTANDRATTAAAVALDAGDHADMAHQSAVVAVDRIDTLAEHMKKQLADLDNYSVAVEKSVPFNFDSYQLGTEAASILDEFATAISQRSGSYLIELQGFTDSIGNDKYNVELSKRRAEAVERYLVDKNVPVYRIYIVGLGETNPVADNKTTEGREKNRRVAVRLFRQAVVEGH